MTKTFDQVGDFKAVHAAEEWCEKQGISVGSMQGPSPRGLMYGNYAIAKWRNLNDKEREELHGTMTGDMRNGPVTVQIREQRR
jgi:hypothetical protein